MRELEVLIALVNKLMGSGLANAAEIYAAQEAIKTLEQKLKDDTAV